MRLTGTALRRARLRSQLLDGAVPAPDVEAVVSRVVGVQAQDRAAAALCIRSRTRGLRADDVERAVTQARSVVLTWSLRGTRHYHAAADVRWLVGVVGPTFSSPGRRAEQLGVAGEQGSRALRELRDALSRQGPLARPVVKERLSRVGVDPSGQAAIHVLRRAALEGWLCVVVGEDGHERYALVDDWLPATVAPESGGVPELVRRYLAGFGPATPADFAAWSGLPARVVGEAWAAVEPELVPAHAPTGPVWILRSQEEASHGRAHRAPARLVGGFDSLLLGYADRSVHLRPDHARRVNAGGGMVKPAVISDGEVVGTWAHRRGASPRVEVRPFRTLTDAETAELQAEAADVGRFLGTEPELTVLGP